MREKGEVGEVLHVSRSGRMIIRSSGSDVAGLSRGTILVDAKGRSIAKVIELIGPVHSPYISALPLTDRVKKYIGARLYVARADGSRKVRRQDGKRVERERRREKYKEKEEEE